MMFPSKCGKEKWAVGLQPETLLRGIKKKEKIKRNNSRWNWKQKKYVGHSEKYIWKNSKWSEIQI